jgi:hypothetical protein
MVAVFPVVGGLDEEIEVKLYPRLTVIIPVAATEPQPPVRGIE